MALAAVKREMKERQFHAKKAVLGQAHSGHGGAAFLEGSAGQHEALQELLLVSLSTDGNGEGCAPWGRVAAPHCPHTVSSPKEWESKGTPHPPPHPPHAAFLTQEKELHHPEPLSNVPLLLISKLSPHHWQMI